MQFVKMRIYFIKQINKNLFNLELEYRSDVMNASSNNFQKLRLNNKMKL